MTSPALVRYDVDHPDPAALAVAARALREGRLVAFPTETVYGLGAHALDSDAVGRLFAAKGRPADNPLIVHLATADDLPLVASEVTPLAAELADRWWPGPLTIVLDAAGCMPRITTGGLATVAVRVPDHPVATALLAAAGVPVAAPSANRSGRPSPTTAAHVLADLDGDIDILVDGGPCRVGVESTVLDARGSVPVILREGAVTREALGETLHADLPMLAASPGTRHRHYAPACRLYLAAPGDAVRLAATLAESGMRLGLISRDPPPAGVTGIARFCDAADLARSLYDALRAAEQADLDAVVVESVSEEGIGRAVMDRLRRAATGSHEQESRHED